MSDNKKKTPTWRDRVKELDHVPGMEMPDKDLAWEKLNKRLRSPLFQIDKWLAAAAMLGTIITPWESDDDDNDEEQSW